jgi:hypothetical protein
VFKPIVAVVVVLRPRNDKSVCRTCTCHRSSVGRGAVLQSDDRVSQGVKNAGPTGEFSRLFSHIAAGPTLRSAADMATQMRRPSVRDAFCFAASLSATWALTWQKQPLPSHTARSPDGVAPGQRIHSPPVDRQRYSPPASASNFAERLDLIGARQPSAARSSIIRLRISNVFEPRARSVVFCHTPLQTTSTRNAGVTVVRLILPSPPPHAPWQ